MDYEKTCGNFNLAYLHKHFVFVENGLIGMNGMNSQALAISNIFYATDAEKNALEMYQTQILFKNLLFIVRYNLYPQKN